MTFQAAKRELQKLAGDDRCCSLWYDIIIHGRHFDGTDGGEMASCRVYIEGYPFHVGETWREALDSLKKALKPRGKKALRSEMPTDGNDKKSKRGGE